MNKKKAIETLREFNAWRRDGGPIGVGPEMPDPHEVGEAIDYAIEHMSKDQKPEREYYGG